MKKIGLMIASLCLAASSNVFAGQFLLVNGTSSVLNEVYISSSGSEDWEENMIEGYVLPAGNQIKITIPNYSKFDLLIRSTDGGEEEYYEYPGNVTKIILKGANNSDYYQ